MPSWVTQGVIVDPIDGALLADTGPRDAGSLTLTLLVLVTQACLATLHLRNALNNGDISTQALFLATNFQAHNLGTFLLELNQRITITLDQGFIGSIQCSLIG